jgi:hypothetical protein
VLEYFGFRSGQTTGLGKFAAPPNILRRTCNAFLQLHPLRLHKASLSAICEFASPLISRLQRMAGLTGRTAAWRSVGQRQVSQFILGPVLLFFFGLSLKNRFRMK